MNRERKKTIRCHYHRTNIYSVAAYFFCSSECIIISPPEDNIWRYDVVITKIMKAKELFLNKSIMKSVFNWYRVKRELDLIIKAVNFEHETHFPPVDLSFSFFITIR